MGKIQKGKIVEKGTCEGEGHTGSRYTLIDGDPNEVYDCLLTSPSGPQSTLNMCEACIEIAEMCGFEVINSDLELVK
tara:strand:+ start:132 stop:362 length:231 start_codon:yes stop_codon:yes gene_type:complete